MRKHLPIAALLLLVSLPAFAGLPTGEDYLQQAGGYENGRGVSRDPARAYRLYCLAAIGGQTDAYYHLGWMYFNGRGVEHNREIAAGWFARGAKAGDRISANILRRGPAGPGSGLPRDHTQDPSGPPDQKLVRLMAPEYGLDPQLVLALIEAESNFNPRARSHKGAIGLMQLIPATARRFGVRRITDPLQNLQGGMAYLQWLSGNFKGELPLILAAYNAGEQAVERHRGIPPYRETRHYVKHITRNYRKVSLATGISGKRPDLRAF